MLVRPCVREICSSSTFVAVAGCCCCGMGRRRRAAYLSNLQLCKREIRCNLVTCKKSHHKREQPWMSTLLEKRSRLTSSPGCRCDNGDDDGGEVSGWFLRRRRGQQSFPAALLCRCVCRMRACVRGECVCHGLGWLAVYIGSSRLSSTPRPSKRRRPRC